MENSLDVTNSPAILSSSETSIDYYDDLFRYHQSLEFDKIHRLFNNQNPLNMDKCYIDLKFSQRNLLEEEKIVPINQIFQQQTSAGKNPHRVMIYGAPGSGKSTLCKQLLYRYHNLEMSLWRDKFDYLVWIPLRNLIVAAHQLVAAPVTLSLSEIIHQTIYHNDKENLIDAQQFARIITANSTRTCFLLDGLDEIVSHKYLMESVKIKILANRDFRVIMTTRFSSHGIDRDLELKIQPLGVSDNNNYIGMLVNEKLLKTKDADEIRSFLQSPTSVGLVTSPLHLDVLCWTCQLIQPRYDGSSITNTKLFDKMQKIFWIWCLRYKGWNVSPALAQNADFHAMRDHLYKPSWRQINDCVGLEMKFLRRLAFYGLETGQTQFDQQSIDQMLKEITPPNETLYNGLTENDFIANIYNSGFLMTESKDLRGCSYFTHKLYQELFAAEFIVDCLTEGGGQIPFMNNKVSSSITFADYVNRHKYNLVNYRVVWQFLSGKLTGQLLYNFFSFLDEAPKDSIRDEHLSLLFRCLEEAHTQISSLFSDFSYDKYIMDPFIERNLSLLKYYLKSYSSEEFIKKFDCSRVAKKLLTKVRIQNNSESDLSLAPTKYMVIEHGENSKKNFFMEESKQITEL